MTARGSCRPTSATRPRCRPRSTSRRELGTLRIVVNCAGVGTPGRVVGKRGPLPLEQFANVIKINLVGTFNVLRLAAAAMLANDPVDGDRGVIVMTASHRRLRRPDRPGRVCREQGWRRRPHPDVPRETWRTRGSAS